MTFKLITAIFTTYSNNFKVLHWGCKGKQFDRMHKLAEKYYNMTAEDLDVLAEMAMRLGYAPATIVNAIDIMDQSNKNFLVFDKFKEVKYEEFCTYVRFMLKSICSSIEELLTKEELSNPSNVGIKGSLEGLHDKYDLEHRYLNNRRTEE